MKRGLLVLCAIFILSGCWDDAKSDPQPKACLDILAMHDDIWPIMYNKCTGESWMLVKVIIKDATKDDPQIFSYQWQKLEKYSFPPALSHGL